MSQSWRGQGPRVFLWPLVAVVIINQGQMERMRDFLVLLLGSLVMWGLGTYLNKVRPQQQLDREMDRLRNMVASSVASGRFSVGMRNPAEVTPEETEADARWFLGQEEKRLRGNCSVNIGCCGCRSSTSESDSPS